MECGKISWIIDTSRSLMGFNRKLRTRFEELEAKGKKLSECEHYMEEVSRRVRQPNRRYDKPGSAYKFRTGTFLVIIDSINGELQKRLIAHTGIAKRFGLLQNLRTCQTIKWSQVRRACKNHTPRVLKPVCLTSCCSLLVFLIWNQLRNHWMDATACPATPAASPAQL